MVFLRFWLVISILFPLDLRAENNTIPKLFNGLVSKRFCGKVTENDLNSLPKECKHPFAALYTFNESLFEATIFQMAAFLQLKKNACIQKRTEHLKSDVFFDKWILFLAKSWLGLRRSQLLVAKCNQASLRIEEPLGGRFNMNFNSKQEIDHKLAEICSNPETMSSLRAAEKIFQFTVPVQSSPDFFSIFTKHRDFVKSEKTQKPLTDEEILTADLSDLSFLYLDEEVVSGLKKDLDKKMDELAEERMRATKKLKKVRSKDGKYFRLEDTLRDYLFDDDTVTEVLEMTGNIDTSLVTGESYKLSNGAKCILNHYEATAAGELAELSTISLLLGKLFSPISKAKQFAGAKSSANAAVLASGPLMVLQTWRESMKVCRNPEYRDAKIVTPARKEVSARQKGKRIKDLTGFGVFPFDFPADKECEALPAKFMMNDFRYSNCIVNALYTATVLAPLWTALPVMGLDIMDH